MKEIYSYIVLNGFDSQSLTPGTFVSDFQIDQIKQSIQYAGSIDDAFRTIWYGVLPKSY